MGAVDDYVAAREAEQPYPFDAYANGWRVDDSDPARVVWVVPLLFTAAVIVGPDRAAGYLDRWCYGSVGAAIVAAEAWAAAGQAGEPVGWHRHPATGRRRDGDREWIEP